MTRDARTTVDVFPGSALAERRRLFAALQDVCPVRFRAHPGDGRGGDGVIAFGAAEPALRSAGESRRPRPALVFRGGGPAHGAQPAGRGAGELHAVRLSPDAALDRRLRGIVLTDLVTAVTAPDEDAIVLAAGGSGPVWTATAGAVARHTVGADLEELGPDEVLWTRLARRPVGLVAVVHFLRTLARDHGWRPPPLRATFMVDDPNLRWRSYGFIDYRRLVRHADEHGYHVAMAMIPLDAGHAHRPTVDLFARRPDRVSLLVHGNDHIRQELGTLSQPRRALAAAAQAQRRIGRFQARYGPRVDRVMAPPHGACAPEMARALGAVGFDAVCGAVLRAEDLPADRPAAGWRPADFIGGCAVLPRIPLASSRASVALRAFLDHPLVIYLHHQDLADGLEPLAACAAAVGELGDVRWESAGAIAESNAELRTADGRAIARPFSRRLSLALEPGVTELTVEAPEDLVAPGEFVGFSVDGGPPIAFGRPARVTGRRVAVRLHGQADVDPAGVPAPAWTARPRLRRAAVEVRDRALPLATAAGLRR